MGTFFIFLAVLVVLILAHEFGHFIVAKRSGIRVDEFGVGFPPKIAGKRIGETEYSLNWLPIGGFVRIWGEDPTQEHYDGPDNARSFVTKPKYIQAAVLVAGVAMNVLLAFVLYVAAYSTGMPTAVDEAEEPVRAAQSDIYIGLVFPDTPAASALKTNDKLLAVRADDGALSESERRSPSKVSAFVGRHEGRPVTFEVLRRDEPVTVTVTPARHVIPDEPDRVAAGFSMTLVSMDRLPLSAALIAAGKQTYTALGDIFLGLWGLVQKAVEGTADYSQVTGPVGMAGMVGDAAAMGMSWLMTFTALISLNLAVINLLPVPALDGGRLLFVCIEAVIRRPIKPVIARRVNQIGFMALLALMALVTAHDIIIKIHG